jgi:peptidoglycan L-alanyl-D-glutamate endopeptidase CwlK
LPRDTFLPNLHPQMRKAVLELEDALRLEGIPLRLYEGARSPWRQAELYARGRGGPGLTVTKARAWESFHQYGMAADFVFWHDGVWDWNEPKEGLWHDYSRIADAVGLRSLSFERPHVELPLRLVDLQRGIYPAGDPSWLTWLETNVEQWGQRAKDIAGLIHPAAPPLRSLDERPALVT